MLLKASLYVDDVDDSSDFLRVKGWLEKWGPTVTVRQYSTGGWEHCWNVEVPLQALFELPKAFFCASAWADYPGTLGGPDHPEWLHHPEGGTRDPVPSAKSPT